MDEMCALSQRVVHDLKCMLAPGGHAVLDTLDKFVLTPPRVPTPEPIQVDEPVPVEDEDAGSMLFDDASEQNSMGCHVDQGDNTNMMFASDHENGDEDGGDDVKMDEVKEEPQPTEEIEPEPSSPTPLPVQYDDVEMEDKSGLNREELEKKLFGSDSESEPEPEPEPEPEREEPVKDDDDDDDEQSADEEEEEDETVSNETDDGGKSYRKVDASQFIDDEAEESDCDEDDDDSYGSHAADYVTRKKDGMEVMVPFITESDDDDYDEDMEEDTVIDHSERKAKLKAQLRADRRKRERVHHKIDRVIDRYEGLAEQDEYERQDRMLKKKKEKAKSVAATATSSSSSSTPKVVPVTKPTPKKERPRPTKPAAERTPADSMGTTFAKARAMFAFIVLTNTMTTSAEKKTLLEQESTLLEAKKAVNALKTATSEAMNSLLAMVPSGALKTLTQKSFDATSIQWAAPTSKTKNSHVMVTTSLGYAIKPEAAVLMTMQMKNEHTGDTKPDTIVVPKNVAVFLTFAHRMRHLDTIMYKPYSEQWHNRCTQTENFMEVVKGVAADTKTGEKIYAQWLNYKTSLEKAVSNI